MPSSSLDRLAEASGRLDPGSRALLDLWLVRKLDDPVIATLVGTSADSVAARRGAILERLADDADVPVEEVEPGLRRVIGGGGRASGDGAMGGSGTRAGEAEGAAEGTAKAAAPAEEATKGIPEEAGPRRRRFLLALLVAVVAAGVVALVLAVASGGGGSSGSSGSRSLSLRALPGQAEGPRAGGSLAGDGSLRLDVRGLKRGTYELWLFNSIVDARPVARLRGPSVRLAVRLPASRSRYGYLDLSFEPDDGNPSHSGQSVLRVALPH